MPGTVQSLNPFRVLQAHRNFRLFWIGQTMAAKELLFPKGRDPEGTQKPAV